MCYEENKRMSDGAGCASGVETCMNTEIMTPQEVAKYLKLSLSTVYKFSREGILPGVKLGKHWRYLKKEIDYSFAGVQRCGDAG